MLHLLHTQGTWRDRNSNKQKISQCFGASAMFPHHVADKMMHYTCKNGALAVSIGHFLPHIFERLATPGYDNTIFGRRKLSLAYRGRVAAWFQDGIAA